MVLGLIIYLWGQRYLAPDVLTQRRARGRRQPKQNDDAERVGRASACSW